MAQTSLIIKELPNTEILEQAILLWNIGQKPSKALIFSNEPWKKTITITITSTGDKIANQKVDFIFFLESILPHFYVDTSFKISPSKLEAEASA